MCEMTTPKKLQTSFPTKSSFINLKQLKHLPLLIDQKLGI